MSHAQLMELEFETNLCTELSERGWLYESDGKPLGWDVALAMVPDDVLHWLRTQYPDEYEKAVPGDMIDGQKTDAEGDRKSGAEGKRGTGSVELGGRRNIKKKKKH